MAVYILHSIGFVNCVVLCFFFAVFFTLVKYEDQKGEPLEYKIVENSEIALMAISKVSAEENPILNYVFIIKDKSLAFNANLRSINNNYNEIFTKNKILKCIGNNDQKN